MSEINPIQIGDFDHIEFAVSDLEKAAAPFLRFGFEKIATREILGRKLSSWLLASGQIKILLSRSSDPNDRVSQFVDAHGDGAMDVAFLCDDAHRTFELCVRRGARVAESPRSQRKDFGEVEQASICGIGDVQHSFVSRRGNLFLEGFEVATKVQAAGYGLTRIDHVSFEVASDELAAAVHFYKTTLGFVPLSTASDRFLANPSHTTRLSFNEETVLRDADKGTFLVVNHGLGVQHLAFESANIIESIARIRKDGVKLVEAPAAYYQSLRQLSPSLGDLCSEAEIAGALIDGTPSESLIHTFSPELIGALVFEVLTRKSSHFFGETYFPLLRETLKKEQIRRGVLQETRI